MADRPDEGGEPSLRANRPPLHTNHRPNQPGPVALTPRPLPQPCGLSFSRVVSREREPPHGTAAHVQPQPALPSALAPTGSFSPPGGRRWPIGRMRGVNRPSAQHSRLHHSTTAGRTRPVRPHPSPLPRPPGVELIEGRLAGEGIRAAGPPITCDAVSGPRRTRGFGWMTSGCRLEAYSTTGSDGASPSRCGDARAVSPRKSAGGSANRYRACRR